MNPYQTISSPILNDAGLNCQAVFELTQLSPEVREMLLARCPQAAQYKQMILIGHGGQRFYHALKESGAELVREEGKHPVDDFSVATVQRYLQQDWPECDYEIVYPGAYTVSLQELGKLAGWHHASPFMVGVNQHFGSWFAYRCLVLANTALPLTVALGDASPCDSCASKICISACPAKALEGGEFNLIKCIAYRRLPESKCRNTCIARVSCPVGTEHRYPREQIAYHYGRSIAMIEAYAKKD